MRPAQGKKPHLLSIWWRVAYWYGFVAQFTVLPFHQVRVCLLHKAGGVRQVQGRQGTRGCMHKYTPPCGLRRRSFQTAGHSPGPTVLCRLSATTSSSTPCSRNAARPLSACSRLLASHMQSQAQRLPR